MVIGENMKKALVDTQTNNIKYIASWDNETPVYETYPNSCRVCEVTDTPFEVYPTLIWVDCAEDVVADQYWYDSSDQTIKPIENALYPIQTQPTISA